MEAADLAAPVAPGGLATNAAFQGSDEWMRAQLTRHALKARQRELRDADPTIIAPFNREEFTTRVDVRVHTSECCECVIPTTYSLSIL